VTLPHQPSVLTYPTFLLGVYILPGLDITLVHKFKVTGTSRGCSSSYVYDPVLQLSQLLASTRNKIIS
jgi:hypothetical protein